MKNTWIYVLLVTFASMFGAYNIGDIVQEADNLSWTDNFDYSSSVFNEIDSQQKVVVLFFGGLG